MVGGAPRSLNPLPYLFSPGGVGGGGGFCLFPFTAFGPAKNGPGAVAVVRPAGRGVAGAPAYEVFAASVIAAPFVHYKREAFEHPGQPPVAFSLDLVDKDLDLILALAAQTGTPMEQAVTNRRVVQAAIAAGLADHDLSELATYLRSSSPDGWSAS